MNVTNIHIDDSERAYTNIILAIDRKIDIIILTRKPFIGLCKENFFYIFLFIQCPTRKDSLMRNEKYK